VKLLALLIPAVALAVTVHTDFEVCRDCVSAAVQFPGHLPDAEIHLPALRIAIAFCMKLHTAGFRNGFACCWKLAGQFA